MTEGTDGVRTSNAPGASDCPGETRYRRLLEHSPDPLCVHAAGRVVYVNPAGVRAMAAARAEDLLGRMITDFVHPDSIGPMLARITELHLEGDSSPPAEAVMLRLDGTPVDAEVVSVLSSWDGKPAHQVIFRDLTAIKAAEATLRLQAALVTHATDAIVATTMTGVVTSWNGAAETIYQRPAGAVLGSTISYVMGAKVDPAVIVACGGVAHATHRAADGTARYVRAAAAAMDDGYVLVCSDHTALRRAEQRFHTVVTSLNEGVVILSAGGAPEWINPAAHRILGLSPGAEMPDYSPPGTAIPMCDAEGNAIEHGQRFVARTLTTGAAVLEEVFGYDRPDGMRRWLCVSSRLLDEPDTVRPGVLVTFTDVTEARTARLRLDHRAHHDGLTGLPNRVHAEERAARALHGDAPALAAVMFIDLDNIKTINDVFGHQAGDTVITTAAHRLASALRPGDVLARHGGDEFVALLFGHADHDTLEALSDRMHAALATPLDVDGTRCLLTASIGVVAVSPGDPRDVTQILRDADAAMYQAKIHRATTYYADHHP